MSEKKFDWFGFCGVVFLLCLWLVGICYVGSVMVCWLGGYGPWSAERYRLEAEMKEKENTKKMRAIEYVIHDGKAVNATSMDAEKP